MVRYSRKGQAAMEFLMTYGWAIVAVILSISALAYFGVLNPGRLLPSSCTLFPGVACTDIKVTEDTGGGTPNGVVTLVLSNGLGSNLVISDFELVGINCVSSSKQLNGAILPQTLGDGEQGILTINKCATGNSRSRFKSDISIIYTVASSIFSHTRIGSLVDEVVSGTTMIIYPSADTYLDQAASTTPRGALSFMNLDGTSGAQKKMLLKFDVTTGGMITGATLHVRSISGCILSGALYCFRMLTNNGAWTEGSTWSSYTPGFGTVIAGPLGAIAPSTPHSFNVLGYVSTDGTYSFLVESNRADPSSWHSRTAASSTNWPRLEVTYA